MYDIEVVFGEMALEDAKKQNNRYTYCYDSSKYPNLRLGSIVRVRSVVGVSNATVVKFGSTWSGYKSEIMDLVSPGLDEQKSVTATQLEIPAVDTAESQQKPESNRLSMMQTIRAMEALHKLRGEETNKFESRDALAEVLQGVLGFKFTRHNLDGIMKAMKEDAEKYFNIEELLVQKKRPESAEARYNALLRGIRSLEVRIATLEGRVN
jgi:hypothetical protein